MLMHVYMLLRHPCNPLSENPGYGPSGECDTLSNQLAETNSIKIWLSIKNIKLKLAATTVLFLYPNTNVWFIPLCSLEYLETFLNVQLIATVKPTETACS